MANAATLIKERLYSIMKLFYLLAFIITILGAGFLKKLGASLETGLGWAFGMGALVTIVFWIKSKPDLKDNSAQ